MPNLPVRKLDGQFDFNPRRKIIILLRKKIEKVRNFGEGKLVAVIIHYFLVECDGPRGNRTLNLGLKRPLL